jgi:sugar phosphate permease
LGLVISQGLGSPRPQACSHFPGLNFRPRPLTFQVPYLIAHPWLMAITGFLANGGQAIAALVFVLIPSESTPSRLTATAIGLSTLVGEVVGVAFAPVFAGAVADRCGPAAQLWIASAGALLVLAASLFLTETAPSALQRRHSA